ncbi:MAG TPA: hypothetical protein VMO47_18045, partial [Rhodothermales bacterium]|nr:hypothetical protein [Rhodothermales bacterium]
MTRQLNMTALGGAELRSRVDRRPLESTLQFGTGGFLRGFAEYFIQEAVRQGRLKGGVVVVGSTGSGRIGELAAQDGLYTLLVRGKESGRTVDEPELIHVISRALSARDQWPQVLSVARDPNLELVVSNTTEVGIVLDEEDRIDLNPPRSFPGKLTAALFERARAFDFDPLRGLVVLPCELVERNGDTLRDIVLDLASRWGLGRAFASWVAEANTFCNTLVDRIVPGTPGGADALQLEARLGYHDALLTVAEPYRLWAIEGDDAFA